MEQHAQHHQGTHPGPAEYVKIAVILAIITAIEVGLYYTPAAWKTVKELMVPVLLTLSAIKFAFVVMWFMHLKFDSRLFSTMFVGGLALAGAVLIALMFLFAAFTSHVPGTV